MTIKELNEYCKQHNKQIKVKNGKLNGFLSDKTHNGGNQK